MADCHFDLPVLVLCYLLQVNEVNWRRYCFHRIVSLYVRSVVVAKLLYACTTWSGFTSSDRHRVDAHFRRSKRCGYCHPDLPTFNELLEESDDRLFHKLCSNTGMIWCWKSMIIFSRFNITTKDFWRICYVNCNIRCVCLTKQFHFNETLETSWTKIIRNSLNTKDRRIVHRFGTKDSYWFNPLTPIIAMWVQL